MFRDEISGAPLGGAGACGCVTFNGDWAADVVPLPKVKRAVAGFLDTFDDIDCARMFGGLTKQQVVCSSLPVFRACLTLLIVIVRFGASPCHVVNPSLSSACSPVLAKR